MTIAMTTQYVCFAGHPSSRSVIAVVMHLPCNFDHHLHCLVCVASQGGGVKRLFRKVDNKSSHYDALHPGTVRRNGSFIYEEFLLTGARCSHLTHTE